jgi:hypothetical protein
LIAAAAPLRAKRFHYLRKNRMIRKKKEEKLPHPGDWVGQRCLFQTVDRLRIKLLILNRRRSAD